MNYLQYINMAIPVVTLLIGIWVGHVGFSGWVTQIEADIASIKAAVTKVV